MIDDQVGDGLHSRRFRVQQNRLFRKAIAEFEQRVQGEGRHVGLGPTLAAYSRVMNYEINRSPEGNMWSALPVALLCMIVKKWEEAGQRPPRGRSPIEHRGTFGRSV